MEINLNNLDASIDEAIDVGALPGKILAENHNNVLKNVLKSTGKYVGFNYKSLRRNETIVNPGEVVWNGSSFDSDSEILLKVSKYSIFNEDLLFVLDTLGSKSILHFKDYSGRSGFYQYVSHSSLIDNNGNPYYAINVTTLSYNTNYAYQLTDEEDTVLSFFKKDYYDDILAEVNSIQFEGIKTYQTLASLPSPVGLDNGLAVKVSNDSTLTNNGYYSVVSGTWVKDADLHENTVEESNTTKGVTGKAVYDEIEKLDILRFGEMFKKYELEATGSGTTGSNTTTLEEFGFDGKIFGIKQITEVISSTYSYAYARVGNGLLYQNLNDKIIRFVIKSNMETSFVFRGTNWGAWDSLDGTIGTFYNEILSLNEYNDYTAVVDLKMADFSDFYSTPERISNDNWRRVYFIITANEGAPTPLGVHVLKSYCYDITQAKKEILGSEIVNEYVTKDYMELFFANNLPDSSFEAIPFNDVSLRGGTPPFSYSKSSQTIFNITKIIGEPTSSVMGLYFKFSYDDITDLDQTIVLNPIKKGGSDALNQMKLLKNVSDWSPSNYPIHLTFQEGLQELNIYDEIQSSTQTNIDFYDTANVIYLFIGFFNGFDTSVNINLVLDYDIQIFNKKENFVNIASGLTDTAKNKIKNEIVDEINGLSALDVVCLGDSLTSGAGAGNEQNRAIVIASLQEKGVDIGDLAGISSTTYPIAIREFLGVGANVVNLGVGGENINTISARYGVSPAIITNGFVLPELSSQSVVVANRNTDPLKSMFNHTESVSPLLQGSGGLNPVYVEGIECTLSYNSSSLDYSLSRTSNGLSNLNISPKTAIIPQSQKVYRNPKSAIIWCWQNGGYNDTDDLISKLDKIIANIGTKHYVIVGLHTGTEALRQPQEEALESKYGSFYFNWRRYVSTIALEDFGITPTVDGDFTSDQLSNDVKSDTYLMNIGSLPSSLWRSVYGINGATENDFTHMNGEGYIILGYKLFERLKLLGLNI